ncbi:MAG: ZIP family metal transporter [Bacteroidales bacterium]|nr:ZIP family metal transporter [Bacteroidales bacterium]
MSPIAAYLIITASLLVTGGVASSLRRVGGRWADAVSIFGGAFLLASVFVNLLPHLFVGGFLSPGGWKMGAFVLVGYLVQMALEQLTQGVEHHTDASPADVALPSLLVGLALHGFLEGLPLVDTDGDVHQALLYGIVLHNVPVVLVVVALMMQAGYAPLLRWAWLLLLAVVSPLGSLADGYLLSPSPLVQSAVMGVVVGVLLHVSMDIVQRGKGLGFGWRFALTVAAFGLAYLVPGCPEIYGR